MNGHAKREQLRLLNTIEELILVAQVSHNRILADRVT